MTSDGRHNLQVQAQADAKNDQVAKIAAKKGKAGTTFSTVCWPEECNDAEKLREALLKGYVPFKSNANVFAVSTT